MLLFNFVIYINSVKQLTNMMVVWLWCKVESTIGIREGCQYCQMKTLRLQYEWFFPPLELNVYMVIYLLIVHKNYNSKYKYTSNQSFLEVINVCYILTLQSSLLVNCIIKLICKQVSFHASCTSDSRNDWKKLLFKSFSLSVIIVEISNIHSSKTET